MSATSDVILVTGGNTGLGFEIIKALCRSDRPYTRLLGYRRPSAGQEAVKALEVELKSTSSVITPFQVDLSSDDSLETVVSTIQSQYGRLDILINNAGADFEKRIQKGEIGIRQGWLQSWDTNVAGTHVLVTLAVPLLLKSSNPRLIFITSGTSSLADTERMDNDAFKRINASPKAGWPKEFVANPVTSYRTTKTGLNMLMREWTRILREDGVKVWAVSPGFLATNLGGLTPDGMKKELPIHPLGEVLSLKSSKENAMNTLEKLSEEMELSHGEAKRGRVRDMRFDELHHAA